MPLKIVDDISNKEEGSLNATPHVTYEETSKARVLVELIKNTITELRDDKDMLDHIRECDKSYGSRKLLVRFMSSTISTAERVQALRLPTGPDFSSGLRDKCIMVLSLILTQFFFKREEYDAMELVKLIKTMEESPDSSYGCNHIGRVISDNDTDFIKYIIYNLKEASSFLANASFTNDSKVDYPHIALGVVCMMNIYYSLGGTVEDLTGPARLIVLNKDLFDKMKQGSL